MVVLDSLLHRVLCFCSVCFFLSFLFFPLCLLTISLLSHFSYVLINCLPPFFFSFTVASPLSPFLSPPLPYTLLLCPFFFSFSLFSSLSRSPSSVSAPLTVSFPLLFLSFSLCSAGAVVMENGSGCWTKKMMS